MNKHAVITRTPASGGSLSRQARAFYSQPVGWVALLITSVCLTYGANTVLFWFHAIYRGEEGPPINDVLHWLLDSTLAWMALTPALFFLLPAGSYLLRRSQNRGSLRSATVYIVLVAVAFGVITGPGPLLHDKVVGASAPLGRLVSEVLPHDPTVAARNATATEHSPLTEGLLQMAVGMPVYILIGLLVVTLLRLLTRPNRPSPHPPSRPTADLGRHAMTK
jgi:hypothetical protein